MVMDVYYKYAISITIFNEANSIRVTYPIQLKSELKLEFVSRIHPKLDLKTKNLTDLSMNAMNECPTRYSREILNWNWLNVNFQFK